MKHLESFNIPKYKVGDYIILKDNRQEKFRFRDGNSEYYSIIDDRKWIITPEAKILYIDEQNLQVIVEPAVITQVLREAVAEKGLFYPPDPSSQGSCWIGGNVAENAGGARAVKYGVTKDYVLNLEVVLANGEIIWTGANTLKNSTGYNLTQLMVGSEGTLGIITKIVMKLIPKVNHTVLMLVPFYEANQACEAVSAIFRAGITPSALEFMERDAIDWTLKFVPDLNVQVKDEVQAHLLIEVDGNYPDILFQEAEKIMEVVEQFNIDEVLFAMAALPSVVFELTPLAPLPKVAPFTTMSELKVLTPAKVCAAFVTTPPLS